MMELYLGDYHRCERAFFCDDCTTAWVGLANLGKMFLYAGRIFEFDRLKKGLVIYGI